MNFVRLEVDSLNQLALYNIHLVSNGFGIRSAIKKKIKMCILALTGTRLPTIAVRPACVQK